MKTIALALKNLFSQKLRAVLNIIAIAIAIATLFVFMGLSAGIRQSTLETKFKEAPLTQIKVRPKGKEASLFQILSRKTHLLNEEDLNKIKNLEGVKTVYPETQYRNISSVELNLLGTNFISDAMILGVPYEFIKDDIVNGEKWRGNEEPYPIVIPSQLINLYNYSVANSSHLPAINKNLLIGQEIKIHLNYSAIFQNDSAKQKTITGVIVGASDKTNFLGISMPEDLIHKFNKELYENYEKSFLEFYVETESPEINSKVADKIEELNYQTGYIQKDLASIEQNFLYLKFTLSIISIIILFTAAISIANTFFAGVIERRKEIGILRAIGATPQNILNLFLQEALLLGLIGGLTGVLIGWLTTMLLDKFLLADISETLLATNSLFKLSPWLIIFSIIFAGLISMLAAGIPAGRAAGLHPIEALRS